jgi:hypothetical protein
MITVVITVVVELQSDDNTVSNGTVVIITK